MSEFSFIGIGDEQSEKKLRDIMWEYKKKFDKPGRGAPFAVAGRLQPEKRTNEYLISRYKQCLEENKTVDEVMEYDYGLRDDVWY
jgi:hypothetical protein